MVKGLIAAAEDFSNGGTYTFTNVDPQSVKDANVYNNSSELIGSGQANTNLFVASTGGVGNYAPVHANNYSVTVDGLTYDDWYLPSRNELKKLYANRSAIGNFTTTGTGLSEIYQSSSSYPTDNRASFFVRFSDGWSNFETQPYRVRFVRSFTLQAQTSITVDSFVGDLAGNATSSSFVKGGTAGQIMISQGTSTPTWVSPGTSGNVLTSDGSTWISQTMPSNGIETVNGTANEIEVSTSNTTTTIGLPDNTTISTSLTVNGLYFGNSSGGGNDNLAIGSQMGSGTGHRNTALGKQALDSYAGTSFDNNTAVGYYNLRALTTGSGNTGLGAENMFSLTTGSSNTGVGNQTMLSVTTGNQNTGLGQRAGQSITTGSNNTLLGFNANVSSGSANNETVIGKGATGSGDNTVQLGNTSVTNVNTSGTITAGEITIPNTDGTSGQVLTTDGSGILSWSTPSNGSDSVYNVDTFYAELGGFVIEVRDGGKHGLVVAMQDQDVSTWFPIDNILNDATKHDADGAKFMDWRLPTIRELELIYIAKANISPMWSGNDYWSATRPNYSNAYFINMANGFGTSSYSPGANHSTNNSKAVRAVRTF